MNPGPVKSKFRRRDFLAGLPALACAAHGLASPLAAAETLYELKPDDFGRLKTDFNANRDKVRLVFLLSPT